MANFGRILGENPSFANSWSEWGGAKRHRLSSKCCNPWAKSWLRLIAYSIRFHQCENESLFWGHSFFLWLYGKVWQYKYSNSNKDLWRLHNKLSHPLCRNFNNFSKVAKFAIFALPAAPSEGCNNNKGDHNADFIAFLSQKSNLHQISYLSCDGKPFYGNWVN